MRKLSRVQLIFMTILLPYFAAIIVSAVSSVKFIVALDTTWVIISNLWYFSIVRTLKDTIGIKRGHEVVILSYLIIVSVVFVARLINDSFLSATFTNQIMLAIFFIITLIGFMAIGLLSFDFQLVLKRDGDQKPFVVIFIQLAFFPIGIWVYQDRLKKWTYDS